MQGQAETHLETQSALAQAYSARKFPAKAMGTASAILSRLETTTRVTIAGYTGSGKSTVLNLLAGTDLIPNLPTPCALQLVWGETIRTVLTLHDGSVLTIEGAPNYDQMAELEPIMLRVEAPLVALKKISLLEMTLPEDPNDQIRAMHWASRQTDIAIWCTGDFVDHEQSLWAHLPDKLKDHAILLQTQSGANGQEARPLDATARDGFARTIEIAAKDAIDLKSAPGPIDKAEFKKTGAMALFSTVMRFIEQGRQDAVDQAEILLHTHRDYTPPVDQVPDTKVWLKQEPNKPVLANPLPQSIPEDPEQSLLPEPVLEDHPSVEMDAAPAIESPPETAQKQEPTHVEEPRAEAVSVSQDLAPATIIPPDFIDAFEFNTEAPQVTPEQARIDRRAAIESSIKVLQKCGTDLMKDTAPSPRAVLDRARDDVMAVAEAMNALPNGGEKLRLLQRQAQDCADLVQLLAFDGDIHSARDAITALLQLKRHLQGALNCSETQNEQ